jgi:hypothetical protein
MKHLTRLFVFAAVALAGAAMAQQGALRTVYIFPMANGLDQYLAAQIAQEHVMQVVADPKLADLVMTERLGESFEQALAKIHPNDSDPAPSDNPRHAFQSRGGKGTIFLVDAKSRQVIWSDFENPPNTASSSSLVREASRIVKKLQATPTK